jgi:hypothetical protein
MSALARNGFAAANRRIRFRRRTGLLHMKREVRVWQQLLQKSKVASDRITLKREAIDDSDYLSRATEVAHEFCVRRRGPSDLYTRIALAALRIFDAFGKMTFATVSPQNRRGPMSVLLRYPQQSGRDGIARAHQLRQSRSRLS